MKRLTIEEIEQMTKSKFVCKQKMRIIDEFFGDDKSHTLEFELFDGFAYCPSFNGKEVFMNYPRTEYFKLGKDLEKDLRDYLKLSETEEITVQHIMSAYNIIYA